MKTTIIILLGLGFLFSTPTMAQNVKNTFELEGIKLKQCKNREGKCLVLKGKGLYERMDYPRMKVFINDKLVADTDQLYGISIENGYEISTELKKLPEDFECLLVVTALHRNKGDLFRCQEEEKKEKIEKKKIQLKEVSFTKIDDKKFIRLDFKPFAKEYFWPYPLFKIEMNGKVIAERKLSSYTLTRVELVPTELDSLPKKFKLTLTLGTHSDSNQIEVVEYEQ